VKRLVEFELEDGGTLLVEVDEPERGRGAVPAGRGRRRGEPGKADEKFETVLAKIKPVGTALIAKIRELADPPDEVGVEFGLKLNATAGVVVASAATEANFKVSLTWKRAGD